MITSVNNIITNPIQTSSVQQTASLASSNLDRYEPTTAPTYDYAVYGHNYPQDEFEQNLSPDQNLISQRNMIIFLDSKCTVACA